MDKKFNCTFSISATVEKTYIVTNLPISIQEEDLERCTSQELKDVASDIICGLFEERALSLEEKGTLIQTDNAINFVEFVKTPKEIEN